jgi:hypothetical protein
MAFNDETPLDPWATSPAHSLTRPSASGVSNDTRASVPDVCEVVSRVLIAGNARAAHRTHESGRAA